MFIDYLKINFEVIFEFRRIRGVFRSIFCGKKMNREL